ncbi:hypothetical protein B0H11DRAFT_1912989 [Mycena galericulata]|nr:hypothetical protein B0H11DRAFT_1912989 [Mycena galericulata]
MAWPDLPVTSSYILHPPFGSPTSPSANSIIIALTKTFHAEKDTIANGWKLSRCYVCLLLVPRASEFPAYPVATFRTLRSYSFQAQSYFNRMTWIGVNNVSRATIIRIFSAHWVCLAVNPPPFAQTLYQGFSPVAAVALMFPLNIFISRSIIRHHQSTFNGGWRLVYVDDLQTFLGHWNTGCLPINSNVGDDPQYRLLLAFNNSIISDHEIPGVIFSFIAPVPASLGSVPQFFLGILWRTAYPELVHIFSLAVFLDGVTLNVLPKALRLLGSLWLPGNAIAMNYSKPRFAYNDGRSPASTLPDFNDARTNTFFTASVLWLLPIPFYLGRNTHAVGEIHSATDPGRESDPIMFRSGGTRHGRSQHQTANIQQHPLGFRTFAKMFPSIACEHPLAINSWTGVNLSSQARTIFRDENWPYVWFGAAMERVEPPTRLVVKTDTQALDFTTVHTRKELLGDSPISQSMSMLKGRYTFVRTYETMRPLLWSYYATNEILGQVSILEVGGLNGLILELLSVTVANFRARRAADPSQEIQVQSSDTQGNNGMIDSRFQTVEVKNTTVACVAVLGRLIKFGPARGIPYFASHYHLAPTSWLVLKLSSLPCHVINEEHFRILALMLIPERTSAPNPVKTGIESSLNFCPT